MPGYGWYGTRQKFVGQLQWPVGVIRRKPRLAVQALGSVRTEQHGAQMKLAPFLCGESGNGTVAIAAQSGE